MPRTIRPPRPPALPDTLPGEDRLDAALDRLASRLENSALVRRAKEIEDRLPSIESVEFPTPLGTIKTPALEPPTLVPPQIDERRREVLKAAALDDLAGLIAFIPVVGDIISDPIEDTAMAKLHDTLTPQETIVFQNADKALPLTLLGALYTFSKVK